MRAHILNMHTHTHIIKSVFFHLYCTVIRLVEALGIWPEKLAADVIIYILVVIVQTKIGQMDSFSLAQTSKPSNIILGQYIISL